MQVDVCSLFKSNIMTELHLHDNMCKITNVGKSAKFILHMVNAGFTHCRLLLPFEIRQRYDTKSEKVGLVSSIIWNVLLLSEHSRVSS